MQLKDVHVGNTAQTSLGGGIDYDFNSGFGIGANYIYFDNLYANFTVTSHTTTRDVWKMPSYGLMDMNMKYYFKIGGLSSTLTFNVNNVLNTEYFLGGTDGDMSIQGAKMNALVYYGKSRSGAISMKVKF